MIAPWSQRAANGVLPLLLLAVFLASVAAAAGTSPESGATANYLPFIVAPFHGGPAGCAVAIMPLGDSITHGYGSATMVGYRRPLYESLAAAGYRVNFVGSRRAGATLDFDRDNEGHPGKDAIFIRDHVAEFLGRNRPDIILLHIGTNAIWNKSAETVAAEIDGILTQIDRVDESIVVVLARIINRVNPDDVEYRTTQLNELIQELATRRIAAGDRLVVVDMEHALTYTTLDDAGQEVLVDMADFLHPNDAGSRKMAAVWDAALQAHLGSYCQTAHAARLTSSPDTEAVAGLPYTYQAEASGNPAPVFALALAPAGMTIEPTNGLIAWTPPATGDFVVTVRVTNGVHPPAQQSFVVHVAAVNTCPAETNVFYRLEEPSPLFADALGGPAAVCVDCPAPDAGQVEQARRFDGLDDGLAVAGGGRFDWGADDAFTVEFWLRRPGGCDDATFDYNEVVAGRFDPVSGMAWWVGVSCEHGGRARFVLRDSDGGADLADVVAPTTLTGGEWHHVVAVRDPALLDVRLYVDGRLESVAPVIFSSGFGSAAALDLGRLNLLGGFHLAGTLDEVVIYDKALSERELQLHHAAGYQGQPYCATN